MENLNTNIKKSILCVFPSVWPLEGFGLVAVEAMSLGKLIVAFNRGPTNEIITHEKNGLLAKEGCVDDLAKNMIRLLDSKSKDKTLVKKLGKQAQKDFQEKYLISNLVDDYIIVFEDAKARFLAEKICSERSL